MLIQQIKYEKQIAMAKFIVVDGNYCDGGTGPQQIQYVSTDRWRHN